MSSSLGGLKEYNKHMKLIDIVISLSIKRDEGISSTSNRNKCSKFQKKFFMNIYPMDINAKLS